MKKYNIRTRQSRGRSLTDIERYERYLAQYTERATKIKAKGLIPSAERQIISGSPTLTQEEFVLALESKHRKGVSTTNIIREIVSEQIYDINLQQSRNISELLQELDIVKANGREYSTREIREKFNVIISENKETFQEDKNLLSEINNALKSNSTMSGTERANYISYYIYDSE